MMMMDAKVCWSRAEQLEMVEKELADEEILEPAIESNSISKLNSNLFKKKIRRVMGQRTKLEAFKISIQCMA